MHTGTTALTGGAYTTPLGTIVALASPRGLRAVTYNLDALVDVDQDTPSPALDAFQRYLAAYFGRRFEELPDVPLDLEPTGAPSPSSEILQAIRGVRAGRTATFGDIAKRVGRPQATRAVGAAVARNPLMIVVPCHRIVGASGSLSGYAGGVERKAWLLRHEGVLLV